MPTMWKAQLYTKPMLKLLNDHPLIGEILLIDNDASKADQEFLKEISKLSYFSFPEGNIFVNPAWNWGAKNAKYDKLFIVNDDVIINLLRLDQIYDAITPDKGMIGYSALSYCAYFLEEFDVKAFESLVESGYGSEISMATIDPKQYPVISGMPHEYYGSAYFLHKENYFDIPKEFKIYYGDLYIYLSNLKKGISNYVIDNGFLMTKYSSTVSTCDFAKAITLHETNIMEEVFTKYHLTDIRHQIVNK